MNFPGVIQADESVLDKLMTAKEEGKLIDGHGPGIDGKDLNAHSAVRYSGRPRVFYGGGDGSASGTWYVYSAQTGICLP